MSCSTCDPCENNCGQSCCNNTCLRWGFDGCFLRGRCADGTELTPLDLCAWLKVHETCTELLLVPESGEGDENGGYMLYKNECGDEYKFWVCDFLGLGSIRCLKDVYNYEEAHPCDLFVFDPDCDSDPTNPQHGKWVPYHIPDAGDCVIVPDADGYSKVLVKNECGCIEECKLFVQQNVYEYTLRDSWPDDPDEPFRHGTFTEVIDVLLDQKIPMFNVSDLEVTIQYSYGVQNHSSDGMSGRRNFKSIVVPMSDPDATPALTDIYSKASVLQVCNLTPWGSWEVQACRTFIIPKGEKLYLHHSVECRNMNGDFMPETDTLASSRLHALRVFVKATKGIRV